MGYSAPETPEDAQGRSERAQEQLARKLRRARSMAIQQHHVDQKRAALNSANKNCQNAQLAYEEEERRVENLDDKAENDSRCTTLERMSRNNSTIDTRESDLRQKIDAMMKESEQMVSTTLFREILIPANASVGGISGRI